MLKLKKLITILVLFVVIGACNQTPKTVQVVERLDKSVLDGQKDKDFTESVKEDKKQTFEDFLQIFKNAIQNEDLIMIEQCMQFPFEFKSGGESVFYDNYNEFHEESSGTFSTILEANFIGKDESFYKVRYQNPESVEYFMTFYFIKNNDSFKLVSFAEPH